MAYRLPSCLHRNRYGILYFRIAVPADLRPMIGQAEIYCSLNTSSVRQAADAAQTLRIELWAIFKECRAVTTPEDEQMPTPVDPERLKNVLTFAKQKLYLQNKNERLEAEVHAEIIQRKADRKQHERELDIAIQSKGGESIPKTGIAFDAAMTEFLAIQRKATTRRTYSGRLKDAQIFFGEHKDIRHLEQADLSEYAAHAKKTIPNQTTAGHYVTTLCGMLNHYRITKGWGPELTTRRLIEKKDTPDSHDRDAYTLDDAKVLFLNAAKYRDKEPHKYWVTVAMQFLGCRIEEFAQVNLNTDLLQTSEGKVWYFNINAKPDADGVLRKSLKNKSSWRCLPIHSALVRHGFVEYLADQREKGFSRPFESGWKPATFDEGAAIKWSHYITNWGGRELNKLIAAGSVNNPERKLSYFHSVRHMITRQMGRAGVAEEASEAALGHAYTGKERERYDKLKSDPDQLSSEAIEPGLKELAALLPDQYRS